MLDLVECYMARDTTEAKLIADQLMEHGIPAIADRFACKVLGGSGAKVRLRQNDLPHALGWLNGYEHRRKTRRDDLD